MSNRNFVSGLATAAFLVAALPAVAQDRMGLDVTSDAFTKSETGRAAIEADLANLPAGQVLDLSGKSLNGLNFSGMDFRRVKLQSARINKTNFRGASADEKNQSMGLMRGAFKSTNLDGASFKGANMARAVMEFASLKGADLTDANLRGSELVISPHRLARLEC